MELAIVNEVSDLINTEMHLFADIAKLRWKIGEILGVGNIRPVDMALRVPRSESTLSRCLQFYQKYPIEREADRLITDLKSWRNICQKVLPARTLNPASVEPLSTTAEQTALEVEEFTRANHPIETRQEMAGAAQAAGLSLIASAIQLDPEMDITTPAHVQDIDWKDWVPGSEMNIMLFTKGQVSMAQAMMRLFDCVRCGSPTETTFHHWPKTKGAGGLDWRGLPLCPSCHAYAQENQRDFEEVSNPVGWLQDRLIECVMALSEMKK